MLILKNKMIKTQVVGYTDCNGWEDEFAEDEYVRISQICMSYNHAEICSLQFLYVNRHGNYLRSPLRGVDNIQFSTFRVISLDFEEEFLTGMSGSYGCKDHLSINSLTFKTNKRSHGPFGVKFLEGGSAFNFELGDVEVFNGFHGSSNRYGITSIGLFVKPRPQPQPEPVVKTETTGR